jgi:virginiamycin B lyase
MHVDDIGHREFALAKLAKHPVASPQRLKTSICAKVGEQDMSKISLLLGAAGLSIGCVLSAGAQGLPEGNGKEMVETLCVGCHELGRVTAAGHTREEWPIVVDMMRNVGVPLSADQARLMTDYLAQNFPEKPKPEAALVPGDATVSIKEWVVPTPGSRPHDPLAAADGSLWYTGHMANVLGRLDPKTGQFTEYHLPIANSGPHGLVADKDGNIWFTANFQGYIGKLDPRTRKFSEYPLPDPQARDPHTPLFDQHGILWFTVQSADLVGRLDPATGKVKLVAVPTPKANPYGMVVNYKGIPFFAEFGSNKLASIDPDTMEIHEYALPNPASRPRRVALTSGDVIWYTDYARGYLSRFDPATGKVNEWPSPGGPKSQPYGIAALHGILWYSESGTRPNTLVRFDPKTEKFQTWPIPSGGGVVRNMMATRDGDLALACSGIDRIALVEIK